MDEVAPDRFHRNRYFIDYYQDTRALDELVFVVYPSEGVSVHVCLGKDNSSGKKFTKKQADIARRNAQLVSALCEAEWINLQANGDQLTRSTTDQLIEALEQHEGIKLTRRQAEVALNILRCHSSEGIGLILGISPQTVRVFRKQLYKKCGVSSQAQLFRLVLPFIMP